MISWEGIHGWRLTVPRRTTSLFHQIYNRGTPLIVAMGRVIRRQFAARNYCEENTVLTRTGRCVKDSGAIELSIGMHFCRCRHRSGISSYWLNLRQSGTHHSEPPREDSFDLQIFVNLAHQSVEAQSDGSNSSTPTISQHRDHLLPVLKGFDGRFRERCPPVTKAQRFILFIIH